jgi:hypothetical protein
MLSYVVEVEAEAENHERLCLDLRTKDRQPDAWVVRTVIGLHIWTRHTRESGGLYASE